MGRRAAEYETDGFIDIKQAARVLEVSTRTILRWVKGGRLQPRYATSRGREVLFRTVDVQALQVARRGPETDLYQVKALAMQALSAARVAEEGVARIKELLGETHTVLLRDDTSMRQLYAEAKTPIHVKKRVSPDWLRFWAGVFFAMDELYLQLTGELHGDDEPWRRFINFANCAIRDIGLHEIQQLEESSKLQEAYAYFIRGRDHLREVGAMLCRWRHGRRMAERVFATDRAVKELGVILRN